MPKYEGFQINCGCSCANCRHAVVLEGYDDADGSHYCFNCDDYVKTNQFTCTARTNERVARRQKRIDNQK